MDHLIVETSFETPPTDADLSASARRIEFERCWPAEVFTLEQSAAVV